MAEDAQRARVLVVDDNRFHLELARDVLDDRAEVICCRDANEAYRVLEKAPVDLVISDLTMPGVSGLELLQQVQRLRPGTDFVLMTANATVESAVEALRMGATDYLQKPIRAADMILALERAVARRALLAENLRLRDELVIYESCRLLTSCLEPEDVFAVGLDLLLRAVDTASGFAVYRRSGLSESLGVHASGLPDEASDGLREALSEPKRIDLEGLEDVRVVDSGPFHDALARVGAASDALLLVPVRGEAGEAGVFCVRARPGGFVDEQLAQASIVGGHAAVALRNAERYRNARDRAFIDDVTEVYNARYLLEALDREIRRAERYGTALSVLFLDLDRFKLVNDNHGHLVGSNALRQLSQLLLQCVRQVDTLARYGGDEFTILLVDTDEDVGRIVAERIRKSVAETAFESPDGPMHLTCSVGVATYPRHGRTREAMLDTADKAMYRAKSNGRNRVCSASELD
jgi:diguanylate cyclase (GGDEF)-like protein